MHAERSWLTTWLNSSLKQCWQSFRTLGSKLGADNTGPCGPQDPSGAFCSVPRVNMASIRPCSIFVHVRMLSVRLSKAAKVEI